MKVADIVEVVQRETGLNLKERSKKRVLVDARRIAVELIRAYVEPVPSYYAIGAALNRKHSTIINSCKIHKSLLKNNREYRILFERIENKFGSLKLKIIDLNMQEIRTDLVRVKTYADQLKKSTTWVYELAKKGEIKLVVIDNVKFVKVA